MASISQVLNTITDRPNNWANLWAGLLADLTSIIAGTNTLTGSAPYTPAAILNGASATQAVTVTGAVVGDFVDQLSYTQSTLNLGVSATVTSANTVTVVMNNNTGGSVTLTGGTFNVRVLPAASSVASTTLKTVA